MNYFIIENGAQQGPFSVAELQQKGITQETLVWTEGMADWTPAWQVDELRTLLDGQSAGTATPPPYHPDSTPTDAAQTPPPAQGPQEKPARRHHYALWGVVGLAVVAGLFAATNPSEATHKQAILTHITNGVSSAITGEGDDHNPIAQAVGSLAGMFTSNITEMVLNEALEYHNYLVFSTTSIHIGKHDVRTSVGCLGKVYTVSEDQLTEGLQKAIPTLGDSTGDLSSDNSDNEDNGSTDDVQVQRTEKDTTFVDEAGRAIGRAVVKQVTKTVKQKVSESTDSATSGSVGRIIDEIEKLIGAE